MSKRRSTLPAHWRECALADVADIETRTVRPCAGTMYRYLELEQIEQQTGSILAAPETDGATIGSTKHAFDASHVLYSKLRPNLNKVALPDFSGVASTDLVPLAPRRGLLRDYLAFFLRSPQFVHWAVGHASGTKMPRIGVQQLKSARIPVPPVPVQERIVSVLNRAESIRQRRADALGIADQMLGAMYRDLFGDPLSNPHSWPIRPLGDAVVETRYGTSEQTGLHTSGDPVLRIPNVIRRTIDTSELKYLKVSATEREKLLLKKGDVLVVRTNGNKDYVGRAAVFDLDDEYLFASYLIRIRLDTAVLNPHYVVAYLATSVGRNKIDLNSRTSAGQYNISATALRAIHIPIPPIARQLKFLAQYEQWTQVKATLERGLDGALAGFGALMSKSFTGVLTARFEQENAAVIEEAQSSVEEMPRRVLLVTLMERAQRGVQESLVTALMKLTFLIQMKGEFPWRLYRFVPYHYGPFARDLYADLERLAEEGLIRIDNGDEDKMRLSLADPLRAAEEAERLPPEQCEAIRVVLNEYGGLSHADLLKRVYEEYPAYAKKSRLRKKAAKKQVRRSGG